MNQMGRPEDIANGYAFLASDEARFITGAILSIDGGLVI
ncbi:SDR family oxidoreductase [Escherichia coli]|nr:SDR family oxidoreductase [Escherichia coli]